MPRVTSQQIKRWGREIGFDLVGVAPAVPVERQDKYRQYLAKGYHGEMGYLERNVEMRLDPRRLVAGARSIICTAMNYYTGDEAPGSGEGRVGRYAWGRDYHEVLKERLSALSERIRAAAEGPVVLRRAVDSAPLAEREHAARAGLGWIGKNGLLINEQMGSWFLLGEIVTDLELEYDEPAPERCGSCRRCLDACPTQALVNAYELDSRRCISYLTIESRREVPKALAQKMGDWVFGCDVCQDVCPYNRRAKVTPECDFQPREKWARIDPAEIIELDEEEYQARFSGSAMTRAKREHMAHVSRNFLKNRGRVFSC